MNKLLESMLQAQPDAKGGNDDQDQPAGSQGLCDYDLAENRYIFKGSENSCAVD